LRVTFQSSCTNAKKFFTRFARTLSRWTPSSPRPLAGGWPVFGWVCVAGLVPGVVLGTVVVSRVSPDWLKFGTFLVLLPLILLQAAGLRRPVRAERAAGLALGTGVGILYSVTTISGPPLAIMLNNQGFAKQEFRAGLGLVRLAESSMTAIAYFYAGLFTTASLHLIPWILPSILVGVPVGAWLIRHVRHETFRRVCMSFDAWVVGFGISTLLRILKIVPGWQAYGVLAAVVAIDAVLLYTFFSNDSRARRAAAESRVTEAGRRAVR